VNLEKKFKLKKTLEPIVDRFRNIKISRKLALFYIAAVIVCMLALSVFYYVSIRDYVKGHTSELLTHTLKQAKNNIEYKISMYNKFSDSISINRRIQDMLKGEYSDSDPLEKFEAKEQLINQLDLVFKSYEDMSTLNLYSANNTMPNYKDLQITVNTCSETEFKKYTSGLSLKSKWIYDTPEILKKGIGLIPPISFPSQQLNSNNVVTGKLYAARKIIDIVGESDVGIIKIDINIDSFFGGIKAVGIEDHGWIDITDNDLNFIYSGLNPEKHKVDQRIDWKKEEQVFNGPEKSKIVKIGNMSYVMVYDVLNNSSWKIIYTLPLKDYFSTINNLKIITIIAFILCIIVFAAISGFIASKFTKKICELSDSMEKIQVGNFDVHIPYRGNDEIGHLINGFNIMAIKLADLVKEVYLIQVKEKEAELKALQAQINPHFLYNTLASISWLGMRNDEKDITKISNALAKFYKVSLSKGKNIITVKNEVEHVKAYIDIQDIRYKNKLSIIYSIDEELLETFTIKLILQPFIENAIMHGMWKEKEHINMHLIVKKFEDNIIWQVIDDGIGISRSKQQELMVNTDDAAHGYGVINVDQRIKIFYGDQYGVTIFSREGIGTVITIVTPLNEKGEM
jgi:two-component system, sensor histidine kinase YesM